MFMIKTDSNQHAVKWEIRNMEWEAKEAKSRIHTDQGWVSSAESSMQRRQKDGALAATLFQTLIPLLQFLFLIW